MVSFRLFLICLVISAIIFSCGNNNSNKKSSNTFRYNESEGITSLDPAFSRNRETIWASNHLYNGLVQMDDSLKILPSIAKSWEISEDGKTYTFHLRTDVFFHDHELFKDGKGRKVVAEDFIYSFNRIIDPNVASPGSWLFNNIDYVEERGFKAFEALNDSTINIYLSIPFPPFLGILTMQYFSVVPHEVVDYFKQDFRNNPIGTGPFKFKMWDEGSKMVLLKNENYFEKDEKGVQLPYLDGVSITFIKDKDIEFLKFLSNNLDFINGPEGDTKDAIFTSDGELQAEQQEKFNMLTTPQLNTEYLGILVDDELDIVTKSPLRKKLVRQAINYGFDRKSMMAYLRNNIGTPANAGFIPKGLPSYNEEIVKGYRYNPEKAKELLFAAGFPNGEGLPEITLYTTKDYVDLCEFIQHQLNEIGFKIKIDLNPGITHSELVARSKLNFFRKSWMADYPDAENYLALFYSKNFIPNGPNCTHFKNYDFDKLYEKAQSETNDSLRYHYYQQMDKIIIEEAPIVPLYYDEAVRLIQKNVVGLGVNPQNLLSLKKVRKN
ncbi:MAG: ABC transporter substrate-binding protein [Flavobacteriales bacterium]|nr:MAG: ABC transporter substrate-binding protein [Flavobacteriales bacterium]